MMRKLVLLGLVLCAAGCKHPGSAKLEGHWRGTKADGVTADVQIAANVFAQSTDIIAKGNQISVSTPASKGQIGTYVVDAEDKTNLVIHTDKEPTARETFSFSDDGKSMVWKVDDRKTITFQKVD
jgi:hypothetical protein